MLHAQPIRDLRTGEVGRHEVLLRLLDDDNRLLLPEAFLRSAERFGHIGAIDRWVVRRAIRLIAAAEVSGTDLCLEVNLSGRSIGDPELPRVVEAELEATGIDASRLVLEITETAAIANMDQARELATRLRALGCRFALDDFGSGFSSFWYLKHLPLDYVKIDGEFVRNLASAPADALVVKAMVQIASGLGLRTIAEFVEDEGTLRQLAELGVDYAQGDHVGRPAPALDLLRSPRAAAGLDLVDEAAHVLAGMKGCPRSQFFEDRATICRGRGTLGAPPGAQLAASAPPAGRRADSSVKVSQ